MRAGHMFAGPCMTTIIIIKYFNHIFTVTSGTADCLLITITKIIWDVPGRQPIVFIPHVHQEKYLHLFFLRYISLLALRKFFGVFIMSDSGESVSNLLIIFHLTLNFQT